MRLNSIRAEVVIDNKTLVIEITLRDGYQDRAVPCIVVSKDGVRHNATKVQVSHGA